jgi:hypothetical protein
MDLGGLLRALGYGTVAGLGTAEEQRTRADKQAERLAAERRHQETLGLQRATLDETKRAHDLQMGPASPEEIEPLRTLAEEMGITFPAGGNIHRNALPNYLSLVGSVAGREPFAMMDPETGQHTGDLVRTLKGLNLPGVLTPPEAGGVPGQVETPAAPARRPIPVKLSQVGTFQNNLRQLLKDRRTEYQDANRAGASKAAEADVQSGMSRRDAYSKHKLSALGVKYSEFVGTEPREEKPNIHFGGKGEVIEVTPDKKVVTLRPTREDDENPDKARKGKADADLAELRLKREKAKDAAIQSADELDVLMRAGKPLPLIASRIVRDLRSEAAALMKAAQEFDLTESERAEYAADAKDLMAQATAIATYRPGKPGGASTLPKLSDIVPGISLGTKAQSVAEKITQGR